MLISVLVNRTSDVLNRTTDVLNRTSDVNLNLGWIIEPHNWIIRTPELDNWSPTGPDRKTLSPSKSAREKRNKRRIYHDGKHLIS